MWLYIARRINLFVLTFAILYLLVFMMNKALPGDFLTNLSGIENPAFSQLEQLTAQYRIESSSAQQYFAFVRERVSGNFGLSLTSGLPIFDEISQRLPATIELCLYAMLIALSVGIPLGVLAAFRYKKITDQLIITASLIGYSIPMFWLGVMGIMFFGLELQLLPVAGRINLLHQVEPVTGFIIIDIMLSDLDTKLQAFKDAFAHLIMPTITLALFPVTVVIQITRSAMLEVLDTNYIKAAQARGISPLTIILHHALPNAMQPVLAQVSLQLSTLLTSAMVTEVIFSWPGIGTWLMSAIYQRDYPVISAGILVCASFIIVISIISDLLSIVTTPKRRSANHGKN
jgi:cationic peptide transport system permease protein